MKNVAEFIRWRIVEMVFAVITLVAAHVVVAQTLDFPLGVTVDSASNIYVANTIANNVVVYNSAMKQSATITQGIDGPTSVAVTPAGTVVVANDLSNSITQYQTPGYSQIPETITTGIDEPIQVVVGSYDEMYVVNGTVGVSVYDLFGNYLYGGGAGTATVVISLPYVQFWSPLSDGPYTAQVDFGNPINMARFGVGFAAGEPFTSFVPTMAASNPTNGDVWVTDVLHGIVVHINASGNVVGTFTPSNAPYGIALDTVKQRLIVSEPSANQIEIFNLKTLKRIAVLK